MSIPGLSGGDDPSGTTFATQFTREAPQIEARKLQLMDTTRAFAEDPVDIPLQQVADFQGLQQQAFDRTQQGLGTFQPYLDAATSQLLGSTAAYDPMSYQQYMNPYQDEVIAGIEQQFQKMQNQADAQAVSTGAFGGARQGVQTAELGRQQAQAVGQAQAQNYQQAQQQAQQNFQNQMQRQAQASQGLGALAHNSKHCNRGILHLLCQLVQYSSNVDNKYKTHSIVKTYSSSMSRFNVLVLLVIFIKACHLVVWLQPWALHQRSTH